MKPQPLSQRQLSRATLARQLLLERVSFSAWNAVEWLGGLQAEDVSSPYIGLWARLQGFQTEDLSFGLEERRVVAAPLMRNEVHLATAADFRLWRRSLQPAFERAYKEKCAGKDNQTPVGELLEKARELIADEPRTQSEIEHHLRSQFPQVDADCATLAVMAFIPLVQVPPAGIWKVLESPSYAIADSWLGLPTTSAREGLGHLVIRYLGAFGPSAPEDFEAWAGMTINESVFEDLLPGLQRFRDEDGRILYDLPNAPRPGETTSAPVRILPKGDNLIHSPAHAGRFVPAEHGQSLMEALAQRAPLFLIDGLVAGTWRLEQTDSGTRVLLVPFRPLTAVEADEVSREGEELLGFVEEEGERLGVQLEAVV